MVSLTAKPAWCSAMCGQDKFSGLELCVATSHCYGPGKQPVTGRLSSIGKSNPVADISGFLWAVGCAFLFEGRAR